MAETIYVPSEISLFVTIDDTSSVICEGLTMGKGRIQPMKNNAPSNHVKPRVLNLEIFAL